MVLHDFSIAYRLLESGALDQFKGMFAAVLNGQLVGVGPDSVDLRLTVGQEQGIDPERIAVIHVFDATVLLG
jgi:hypothetical protein